MYSLSLFLIASLTGIKLAILFNKISSCSSSFKLLSASKILSIYLIFPQSIWKFEFKIPLLTFFISRIFIWYCSSMNCFSSSKIFVKTPILPHFYKIGEKSLNTDSLSFVKILLFAKSLNVNLLEIVISL